MRLNQATVSHDGTAKERVWFLQLTSTMWVRVEYKYTVAEESVRLWSRRKMDIGGCSETITVSVLPSGRGFYKAMIAMQGNLRLEDVGRGERSMLQIN
jgi:hypothetical protein